MMEDILIGGLFLIAFSVLMIFIYRIIGDDAKKVHGCCAGGIETEKEKTSEIA